MNVKLKEILDRDLLLFTINFLFLFSGFVQLILKFSFQDCKIDVYILLLINYANIII